MERVKEIVNAKNVYKQELSGKNIRVALLDTGVHLHPDLDDRVIFFKDYINNKKHTYDDNGHGTHIAGILCGAGETGLGMAPKAELLVYKILDKKGKGTTEKALEAIDWILEHHKEWDIRILNFSMGYLPNANPRMQTLLIEKLERLWDEGVVIVAAAGNDGPKENTITVPGISRKIITVGSSDDYGNQVEQKGRVRKRDVGYSGRGPTPCFIVKPEVLAPGTDILSLCNEGGYKRKSGTSMSVPVVCGALALALEKNPNLKPVELKLLLYDTVLRNFNKFKGTWGILDVDNLIKML